MRRSDVSKAGTKCVNAADEVADRYTQLLDALDTDDDGSGQIVAVRRGITDKLYRAIYANRAATQELYEALEEATKALTVDAAARRACDIAADEIELARRTGRILYGA